MDFIDFFSGAGGMRMGLERAGHRCIGFCEYDKYARQSYKAEFDCEAKGEWESHDIRTVNSADIPRADLWAYGFPCQGISTAGKQKGIGKGAEDTEADERSNLFFQIIRLLSGLAEEDRPEWLLCENVKNLLSIDRGYGFARILYCLDEMGYNSEWQLFNTKHSYRVGNTIVSGVPQNRERVYIISHLRKRGRREVFPIARTDREDPAKLQKIAGEWGMNHQAGSVYAKDGLSPSLDTCGGVAESQELSMESIPSEVKEIGHGISKDGKKMQSSHVYDKSGVSPTLTTGTGDNHQPLITESCQAVLTPDREEKQQNGRRMKDDGEPMFTLTAQDRHGVAIQFTRKSIPKEVGVANTLVAAIPKKALGNNSPITAVLDGGGINVIGNYSPSNHNASRIVGTDGIAPTVMENHGTITAVVVNDGIDSNRQ